MNDLQVFNNPEFGEIRAVELDGEPWFVGKDVAEALGYSDTAQAVRKHIDDEDKGVVDSTTPGGVQKVTIINESGVYSLIFSSKLESAKKFKRWVTSEVLPAIRKHGVYVATNAQPQGVEAAALEAALRPFAAAMETMTAAVQALAQRVNNLEQNRGELRALPPGGEGERSTPGAATQRRWMRTVSEKLDLLTIKCGKSNNAILHKIYKDMEDEFEIVLEEERYRVMEEQGLDKCSMLTAIFFDEDFRDYFQRYVDYNLSPENRGW